MPDAAENASASRPSPQSDAATQAGARPVDGGTDAREPSLTDSIADLLQMAVNYLRQETASVMRDKVVLPGQQLGKMVAFALAASFLLALGLAFLSVALLLVLAGWLTWPGALGLIGGILVIGAGIFTALKVRSTQE